MKTLKKILSISFFVASIVNSNAQTTASWTLGTNVTLNPSTAKVGIGTSSPTGKLHILNEQATSNALYGLYSSTINTYSGSGDAYGMRLASTIGENNTGTCYGLMSFSINNNTTSSANTFGLHTNVSSYNQGYAYGHMLTVNGHSTSSGSVYGTRSNVSSASTSPVYGVFSIVSGSGSLYGYYTSTTNNSTTSSFSTFGTQTNVSTQNQGHAYGHNIDVSNNNNSSTANIFGMRSSATTASNESTVYGVYSTVSGGSKRWAGYFTGGDMYVSGNVGIGTTTPYYNLDVAGIIRAHQVKINTNTGADFVFYEDYNLRPLDEVHSFIQTNRHLPEVPSAADMIENGLDMGEFQIKLLQKIEELTLYIIAQDKRIKELEKNAK